MHYFEEWSRVLILVACIGDWLGRFPHWGPRNVAVRVCEEVPDGLQGGGDKFSGHLDFETGFAT